MSLRDRCAQFLTRQDASPVDDLMAFVMSETGRTADPSLAESLVVCLYFRTDEDREDFIAAVKEEKPGMVTRTLP